MTEILWKTSLLAALNLLGTELNDLTALSDESLNISDDHLAWIKSWSQLIVGNGQLMSRKLRLLSKKLMIWWVSFFLHTGEDSRMQCMQFTSVSFSMDLRCPFPIGWFRGIMIVGIPTGPSIPTKRTLSGWGFQHVSTMNGLFSISYMGCHPSHWRTPLFFRGVEDTNPLWIWGMELSPSVCILWPSATWMDSAIDAIDSETLR